MKIYYSDQLNSSFLDGSNFTPSLLENASFSLENGGWVIKSYYSDGEKCKEIKLDKKVSLLSKSCNLYQGKSLESVVTKVEPSSVIGTKNDFVIYYGEDDDGEDRLISESSDNVYSYEGEFLNACILGDYVYFQGLRSNSSFQKRRLNLDLVWEYKLKRLESIALNPVYNQEDVIFIIPSEIGEGDGTKIIAINDETGMESWSDLYNFRAIDYIVLNENLLIAAWDGFYILDMQSRAVFCAQKFDCGDEVQRYSISRRVALYRDSNCIYISHSSLGKLYILGLYNYSKLKTLELPEGIEVGRFMGKDETSGLYYFYASQPRKEVGNTFLLELDPNNLDA
ncbi:hypothetical protein MHM93_19265, partial [Pseudoalteromonas sp. MM17-2]|uniref:hypothetical protein n=1 Tax=Pseudoalteromonas sp. MM17-2 TaxID=2917753 RepID=UPI001EF6725F